MLSDRDLAEVVFGTTGDPRLLDTFPEYDGTKWSDVPPGDPRWLALRSPIQPGSIDLRVGLIYVPGKSAGQLGGEDNPATSYEIGPSESVIVSTYERIEMPPSLGGIVFPPSALSSKGVLVANIGHIDPGYSGPLRFTVINMGAQPISLRRGVDAVGTLLLFRLSRPAEADWRHRGGVVKGEPGKVEIDALATDFGNMSDRIRHVAERTVRAMRRLNATAFVLPIAVSVAIGIATLFYGTGQSIWARLDAIEADVADAKGETANMNVEAVRLHSESSVEIARLQAELDSTRERLSQLEKSSDPRGKR